MPRDAANPGEGQESFGFEGVSSIPTTEETEANRVDREQVVADQADYLGVSAPETPDPNTRREELTKGAGGGISRAAAGDLPGQEVPPKRRPARVGDPIGNGRYGQITSQKQADAINLERATQRLLAAKRAWSPPGPTRAGTARKEIEAMRATLEQTAPTPRAPGVSTPPLKYSEEDRNTALQQTPLLREIPNTDPSPDKP